MDELQRALAPALDAAGLELVDLEVQAGLLRLTVDREGGVDLDALSAANRLVSRTLDELDPISGRYTLEVSSPGLERPLRQPAHFARATGSKVSVRTAAGTAAGTGADASRRITGVLAAADEEGVVVEGPEVPGGSQRLAYAEIERARTVFEWGSASPRPKRAKRSAAGGSRPRTHGEEVTTQ